MLDGAVLLRGGVESGDRLGSNPVECVELMFGGSEESVRLSGRYLVCGETDFREVSGETTCSFGTVGHGKQLNAIAIDSPSEESDSYDIYYRVYLERYGWLEWATNGELSGSNDPSLKIYAIQIIVVRDGSPSPVVEDSTAGTSYVQLSDLISYSAHVRDLGWLPSVREGSVAGTTGRGLSMEALRVSLGDSAVSGAVEARAHVSDLGWQDWAEGSCGTTGRGKALEAVCLRLTGEAADAYDVWYRVHSADFGWLGWAKNGEEAGSEGFGRAAQAVEVRLLPKGSAAPGDTSGAFVDCGVTYSAHVRDLGWLPSVREGSVAGTTGRGLSMEALRVSLGDSAVSGAVEARAHVSDLGWQDWAEGSCGTTGRGKALEAVCLRLTGEAADAYDVWYRVHSADFGWLGWAKNGEEAGSEGFGRAAQAVEVRLLPKGSAAPGDTSGAFINRAGQNLQFKVTYDGVEIKKTLGSDGAYCYSLPSAATADSVSITYTSGSYVSVALGEMGLIVSRGGEVCLTDCDVELGDPYGAVLSVKVGNVVVGSLVFAKSSSIATLSIMSSDPINYGRAYIESSKSHTSSGSISLTDADGTIVYDGGLDQIKGRGNTTWSASKKPYQIKLSKKTDLLESGSKANKSKTWVLLANAYDKTGLRNLTAYNIAISIGVSSAVESRMVDLYYDGEYRGTYQLCEKVQVNSGRVDINNLEDEIDDLNEDVESLPRATAKNKYGNTFQYTKGIVNPDDITGGYLIEYDPGRYAQEASWFTVKMGSQTVAFVCKSPEYWSYEQAIYLSEYFQEAFDSINSGGLNKATGKTSLGYFDKDAAASLYWLNELTLNRDGLSYSSTFIYKDRDSSGSSKLVFGPGWDFDLSLGNDAMIENPNFVNYDWWYTRSVAGLGSFLYSDYHLKRAIDDYRGVAVNTARGYLVDGEYDQAVSELSSSFVLNSRLWGSNSSANSLKSWFLNRLDWMRSQY